MLAGTADNGKAAIALIEETKPDLILTDICMPVLDGIGLAAYVHEHHPEMMVVIISGYDDFDYAKQAMSYEVADYILKPITSVELVEELDKIRKKLEASAESGDSLKRYSRSSGKTCLSCAAIFSAGFWRGVSRREISHPAWSISGFSQKEPFRR